MRPDQNMLEDCFQDCTVTDIFRWITTRLNNYND